MDYWVPIAAVMIGLAILSPRIVRYFKPKPNANANANGGGGCGGCSGCSEASAPKVHHVQTVTLQHKK